MLLCQQGQGNVPYRYALAIACATDGDEMPGDAANLLI